MTPRRTSRILGASVLALSLAFAGAACGDGGDDQPRAEESASTGRADATAGTDTTSVKVALFRFQPGTLEVKAGTSVTWRNDDAILHTVTAGTPGAPSGEFDEELSDKGATASVTFDKPGTFAYFCARHPEAMRGTVTVTG